MAGGTRTSTGTAVYALTAAGAPLARGIAAALSAELYLPARLAGECHGAAGFDSLAHLVARLFQQRRAHVFVAAAGIVVRVIAPHLRGKDSDPAVVVLDQQGSHVVSLLSGHLGGANALAREVAAITGGQSVITTATDSVGAPAIDLMALEAGLAVGDVSRIKQVNAALVEGRPVSVWDPEGRLGPAIDSGEHFRRAEAPDEADVVVDWRLPRKQGALSLHPPCLCLGVGCRRGAPTSDILAAVKSLFTERGAAPQSLAAMASVEAKRDEPGLLQAARELGVPLVFYEAERLDAVETPNPSPRAAQAVGTRSVSEAAALLLAERRTLLAEKRAYSTVTLALAQRKMT